MAALRVIAALVLLPGCAGSGPTTPGPTHASAAPVPPRVWSHVSRASVRRTYYLSPSGNDRSSGRSKSRPWRTIARLNRAALKPGDVVRFRARSRFDDTELIPSHAGSSTRPITYSSYGGGRAVIKRDILLTGVGWLRFTRLVLSGAEHAISSGSSGGGVHDILIDRSAFRDVGVAVNSGSPADGRWVVKGNLIQRTGDSAIILFGHDIQITHNRILHSGLDSSISYGKHGVYAKCPHVWVTRNEIRDFHDDGVSTRFHDAVVKDNLISGGSIGIAWFQDDDTAGTTHWEGNRVFGTTDAGLYVSRSDDGGPTTESFVIKHNRIAPKSGAYIDLQSTKGTYSVCCNLFR